MKDMLTSGIGGSRQSGAPSTDKSLRAPGRRLLITDFVEGASCNREANQYGR